MQVLSSVSFTYSLRCATQFVVLVAVALVCASLALASNASASGYSQLVSKAGADLRAGRATQALTESNRAIAMAPQRWPAYVVSDGALQMEGHYDRAIGDYSKSLPLAPEEKRAAIRQLLRRCLSAEAAAQPHSRSGLDATAPGAQGPATGAREAEATYDDLVNFITRAVAAAGVPQLNPADGSEKARYSISFDGCTGFTVVLRFEWGYETSRDHSIETLTYAFKFGHVYFWAPNSEEQLGIASLDGAGQWHFDEEGPSPFSYQGTLSPADPDIAQYKKANGTAILLGGDVHLVDWVYFGFPGTEGTPAQLVNAFKRLDESCKRATPLEAGTSSPQAELRLWDVVRNSTNPSDFGAYLQRYPSGRFAAEAQRRRTALEAIVKQQEHNAQTARCTTALNQCLVAPSPCQSNPNDVLCADPAREEQREQDECRSTFNLCLTGN